MASSFVDFTPAINKNDHGPKVLLAGGITLAATALMTAVAVYNRFCAKTLHHVDTPLLGLGLVRLKALQAVVRLLANDMTCVGRRVLRNLRISRTKWFRPPRRYVEFETRASLEKG